MTQPPVNRGLFFIVTIISLGFAACTTAVVPDPDPAEIIALPTMNPPTLEAAPTLPPLPVIGPAPELQNDIWINSETPLRLQDLRGKVVLLEFWTFG